MDTQESKRGNPKTRVGYVLKKSMQKTLVVGITVLVKHAMYGKFVKKTKKCYVHDENGVAEIGNKVRIIETRPISKMKRWRVIEVIEK